MELLKLLSLLFLLLILHSAHISSSQEGEPETTAAPSSSPTSVPSSASTSSPFSSTIDTAIDSQNELDHRPSQSSLPKHKQHISDEDLTKLAKIFKVNQKKLPTLKKLGRKINSLIDRVNAADGHIRPELFVHEFIPDPLPVKDIEVKNEESFFSYYAGKFTNVMLHGISGVKISSIRANVGKLTAKIIINVPDVYLTGNYKLDGKVTFVDVNGEGKFRMNISDIEIDAFGNLNRTTDVETGKEVLQIGNIELDVSPGDMDLQFENLQVLGSETIAETIVGTLSPLIFSQVKYSVLERTSSKIRAKINQRLKKIPIDIIESDRSTEALFDDLLAHVTKKLGTKIEPLKLPMIKRNFAAKLLVLNVNASINIYDGKLHGLTTFARTGDIYITYEDDTATIEADVGFRNITGSYNWDLKVLGRGPSGSASLMVRKISAYMRLKQELKRGSVPKLERFRVEEIDHVWMDMNGLGIWDYMLELVVNSVSNVFRVTIANLIASTVTKVLQEELEKAHVSFIP